MNANIYQEVLAPLDTDWIRFFEMDLNLYHTVDPRVFILKGTVKIKQDVDTKSTLIGNFERKNQLVLYCYLYGILMIVKLMTFLKMTLKN